MFHRGALWSLLSALVLLVGVGRTQDSVVHVQEVGNAECMDWCGENEYCVRSDLYDNVLAGCMHLLPRLSCDSRCYDNETCVYSGSLCWPIPGEYDCPYYCLTRLAK